MNHADDAKAAIRTIVGRRIAAVDLLPELEARMLELLDADLQYLTVDRPWWRIFEQVSGMLGNSPFTLPFIAAWTVMHAAAMHLDHLQDGDQVAPQLAGLPPAAHYQLVLSYYVLATSLLDDLPGYGLSLECAVALHRLWNDAMLRIASGQYRDISMAVLGAKDTTIDEYQELIHAKTGAAFGLAFAGLALLNNRSNPLCVAMLTVGELFGGLLQYVDDLIDQTLPIAYSQDAHAQHTLDGVAVPLRDPSFWARIFPSYRAAVERLLTDYEPELTPPMLALFDHTFRRPSAAIASAQ